MKKDNLIESYRVKETKERSRKLVTLTSELKFNVRNITSNVIRYEAINEKQEVKPRGNTSWKFTEQLNQDKLNQKKLTTTYSNPVEWNQSEMESSQSNLFIIITVTLKALFTLGIVSFLVVRYMKNKNP